MPRPAALKRASPVALVTGTSRGVGAAIAGALLKRGWRVHGFARGSAPAELERAGLVQHRVDLGDLAALEALFTPAFATALDLPEAARVALINNAGLLAMAPVQALDLRALDGTLRINVAAPVWLMGWCIAQVLAATRLDLVNLSSGAAGSPYPGWLTYCTSKAALRMAGRTVAADVAEQPALAGRPIHVLDYAPGVVATEMQAEIRSADPASFPRRARFESLHADGDLVDPAGPAAEIAELLERPDPPPFEERRFGQA